MMKKEVENTVPVIPVKGMTESIAFYQDKLGFQLDWGNPESDSVCGISRDGHGIMLKKTEGNFTPSCVWIGLESENLIEECMNNNVTVTQEPTNQPWAYEIKILDYNGNILWLGTEPRK